MPTTNSGSPATASVSHRQRVVERPVPASCGDDPDQDRERDADQRREEHEEGRVHDARPEQLRHGLPGDQRVSEVAGEHAREPVPVLLGDGSVEIQLLPQRGERLGRGGPAEDGPGRIARQRLGRGEDDDRGNEKREDAEQRPPHDEAGDAPEDPRPPSAARERGPGLAEEAGADRVGADDCLCGRRREAGAALDGPGRVGFCRARRQRRSSGSRCRTCSG